MYYVCFLFKLISSRFYLTSLRIESGEGSLEVVIFLLVIVSVSIDIFSLVDKRVDLILLSLSIGCKIIKSLI